jgi:hypothetical protein
MYQHHLLVESKVKKYIKFSTTLYLKKDKFSKLRREVIVCFVDFDGIVHHQLFKLSFHNKKDWDVIYSCVEEKFTLGQVLHLTMSRIRTQNFSCDGH